MTREQQKAYVKNWGETGRWLEEIRWRELASLDDTAALRATKDLLELGLLTPLPPHRHTWSGLIDLQDLLHSRQDP
ncbi:MAG TPA: hypothetical protein VMO26_20585 [Vicinamibacterales bacterium]|nr:hypothetical protein [Vicinamibacterales bacterium]